MAFYCPHCNAQIVNRRLTKCYTCWNDIPEDLQFTDEQAKALDDINEQVEKSRKKIAVEARRDAENRRYRYDI